MKKGVSPLTTVLVILLVLAIAALAYFYFSTPRQEAKGPQAGGGMAPIAPGQATGEFKPAGPEARQKAEEAKKKLEEQRRSGKTPGQ